MNNQNFWNDKDKSNSILNEISNLKSIIMPIEQLETKINNNIETI